MGIRLVKYNKESSETGGASSYSDHDELINRDLMNQHPIYAIIGLQEVLNLLEDSVEEANAVLIQKEESLDNQMNVIIENINASNQQMQNILDAFGELNTIENVVDTPSIDLQYDEDTNELSASVKLYYDEDYNNIIRENKNGIYVNEINPLDTQTISWERENPGESNYDFFMGHNRFCHSPNSYNDMISTAYQDYWTCPSLLYFYIQNYTYSYFTGRLSTGEYDNFKISTRISSSSNYQRANAIIIGRVIDEDGNPRTLSVVISRGIPNFYYGIVLDYNLPGETIIKQGNAIDGTLQTSVSGSWNSYTQYGITVNVEKFGHIVSVVTSDWNVNSINENTKLTIDLSDYSWGYLFSGLVKYGYGNHGQPYSKFTPISFTYDNLKLSVLSGNIILSEDITNGLSVKDDGLYADTIYISEKENNALTKDADGYIGYYVEETMISKQEDNSLKKLEDGFYVRDESNTKKVNLIAHNFIEGDFIYYHPSNGYSKALAIDDYNSNIIGMVSKIIDEDNFEYKWAGFHETSVFNDLHGYAQGMPLYISDTEEGKVTQRQPDISKTVGYPVEDVGIIISIERGIQYNQEAAIGDFKQSPNTYNVRSDGFIRVVDGVLYKMTLVESLLNTVDDAFKSAYLVINETDSTVQFINSDDLYAANNVLNGLNLFIKAF